MSAESAGTPETLSTARFVCASNDTLITASRHPARGRRIFTADDESKIAERMKIHYHKRRSAQHIAVDKEYLSILRKYQQNRCFYCGQDMGEHPAIEHLTPVSHGGDNQRWNLVYSCRSCNSKKHDKTMEEYAITTGDVYGISNRYEAILARVYAPYMEQLNKR